MHKAGRTPPWEVQVRRTKGSRSSRKKYKGVKGAAASDDGDANVDGIETKDRKAVSVRRLLRQVLGTAGRWSCPRTGPRRLRR